ncbi:hypothetical protein SprV_0902750300 [Sparganum proliferum]
MTEVRNDVQNMGPECAVDSVINLSSVNCANRPATAARRRAISYSFLDCIDTENAGQSCSGCQILDVKVNYLEEEITKMKAQLRCSLDQANATNMPTERVTRSKAKAPTKKVTPAPITAAPKRIAKKRDNNGQKGNPKTEEKKNSNCKKAKGDGRLLPEDASVEAETKTLTDVPSLMANVVCPNTLTDSPEQFELDRPSTSAGIDSSIRATEFYSQSSLPSASSKVVKTTVKQTDGVSSSAPPSPAHSPRALRHLGNHTSVENKKETDREKCPIIQGLLESSANTPKGRVSEDPSVLQGLLNNILEPTEAIEVIKALRLGKRADNPSVSICPRHLNVVPASSDQASLNLSRRFRIKGSNLGVFSTGLLASGTAETSSTSARTKKEAQRVGGQFSYIQQPSTATSVTLPLDRSGPNDRAANILMFLVYVNELDCDVAMFADDIKIWSTIRNEVDEAQLQTNLDHLEQWSKDWLLPFNVNKCNFLRVGGTTSPNRTVYHLTDQPLQEVDAQKDFGVWITTSLKPSLQCSKVAKSEMSILYLVKRTFSSFDEDCFVKVFGTFVRPHMELAIQAWRPWTATDLGILEKVQRRATELVSGPWSLPYETRSANLDFFPLNYRHIRGHLIQAFRIVRNQGCRLASGDFFELATTTNLRPSTQITCDWFPARHTEVLLQKSGCSLECFA